METIIALQAMEEPAAHGEAGLIQTGQTSAISVFSDCSSAINCTASEMCSAYCY